MIENITVLIIVAILVYLSESKRAVGWLVFCFYAIYIIMELDFFGLTFSSSYSSHQDALIWYLLCTSISLLFLILSLIIHLHTKSKTSLLYAVWLIFDMFITGLSAIFQAFDTNSMLMVYNIVQNTNILVDLLAVAMGTDSRIKGIHHVRGAVNSIYNYAAGYIYISLKNSNRHQ